VNRPARRRQCAADGAFQAAGRLQHPGRWLPRVEARDPAGNPGLVMENRQGVPAGTPRHIESCVRNSHPDNDLRLAQAWLRSRCAPRFARPG
jgi:hypothetical protein